MDDLNNFGAIVQQIGSTPLVGIIAWIVWKADKRLEGIENRIVDLIKEVSKVVSKGE